MRVFSWTAVVLALLVGLALGLVIRGRQSAAAEAHAARAEKRYAAAAVRESLYVRERRAERDARTRAQATADSTRQAADDSLAAARTRVTLADARAAARIAAAVTVEQQRDTYRDLYQETLAERDRFGLIAMQQQRATAQLRALAREDSATIARSDARGDRWKSVADSLLDAQHDLLAHRPSGITIRGLGLGGAVTAALAATVCLSTKVC